MREKHMSYSIFELFSNIKRLILCFIVAHKLISEAIVKKLGLLTTPHKKPYPLGWLSDKAQLQVTRQCKLKFSFGSGFVDEVELDIIPFDICGIVLGGPYLYDRKAIFYRAKNKYLLLKDGIEYFVTAHKLKNNYTLINLGQMK